MINNSEVLITGGYGFIGAHIAKGLAEYSLGNSVTLFDKNVGQDTTGDNLGLNGYDNVKIVEGSVLDPSDYAELPKNYNYIVNAAGYLGIDRVSQNQLETLDTNTLGARNCLEFAAQHSEMSSYLFSEHSSHSPA